MINPNDDALSKFADWFLRSNSNGIINRISPPNHTPMFIDGVTGITLYYKPPFQVELFIAKPNTIVPDHIHPNVDSFEIALYGVTFSKHKKFMDEEGTMYSNLRVKPNDVHGGKSGALGGAFLSIQQWLNGTQPKNIALDWQGQEMDSTHKELLNV